MNNKGSVGDIIALIGVVLAILIFISAIIFVIYMDFREIKHYSLYDNFCDQRPNFCLCSLLEGCSFHGKSSQHCINGVCSEEELSEDTKALCDLAKEINDKEVIFEMGCNNGDNN